MVPTDVSKLDEVQRLRDRVYETFGEVAVLMNNAGTSPGGGPWDHYERWQRVLNVNLWGVINGVQSFTQAMIDQHSPGAIVNTGSKQGITCPPGDTAYNISKAGVKVLTEGLAHALRNVEGCRITAHLLVPGLTFTGMTRRGRTTKPPGSWVPTRSSTCSLPGWRPATSMSSAPITMSPEISTTGASSGLRRTSSVIARRCRAGTPTTATNSPPSWLRKPRFGAETAPKPSPGLPVARFADRCAGCETGAQIGLTTDIYN